MQNPGFDKPVKGSRLLTPLAITVCFGLAGQASARTLHDVVQQTVNSNPLVQFSRNQYLADREQIRQAKAGYFPKVDLTAGIGREWSDNNTTRINGRRNGLDLTRKELGLLVTQNLYDGHTTTNETERFRAKARASAHKLLGDANAAALRAAQAYLDVLRNQELLRLSRQSLGIHQRIRDQVKLRSDSGVGRTADLDQINARLALAQNSVAAARANLEDAKTTFNRVVGEDPGKLTKPHGLSKDLPNCETRDAVISALENHPTLKSAYADVDEATEQYESSSGVFHPRVDLELGASRNFDLDGSQGEDSDASAMLRMRWNLYNGGKDSARRRETAHLVNQAKDVRNRTHREVEESVRLSCTALRTTRRQIPILRSQVSASAKTRDAYVQQFNLNERTLLDVLNTENDLLQSRKDLANTSYDNLYAQFRVANDVGVLTELMHVTVYNREQPAELHKAIRIKDYTNTKYPNNEYMKGVNEHQMNVFPFPDD